MSLGQTLFSTTTAAAVHVAKVPTRARRFQVAPELLPHLRLSPESTQMRKPRNTGYDSE